jgi:hypothetical protein
MHSESLKMQRHPRAGIDSGGARISKDAGIVVLKIKVFRGTPTGACFGAMSGLAVE